MSFVNKLFVLLTEAQMILLWKKSNYDFPRKTYIQDKKSTPIYSMQDWSRQVDKNWQIELTKQSIQISIIWVNLLLLLTRRRRRRIMMHVQVKNLDLPHFIKHKHYLSISAQLFLFSPDLYSYIYLWSHNYTFMQIYLKLYS